MGTCKQNDSKPKSTKTMYNTDILNIQQILEWNPRAIYIKATISNAYSRPVLYYFKD